MKTTSYIFAIFFVAIFFTSCTPEAIYDHTDTTQSTVLGEHENDPEGEEDVDNGL